MSLTAQDYADLSSDAYNDDRNLVGSKKTLTLNGHAYKVIAVQSSASGFQATAYRQRESPYAIIIAYRGTQGLHDAATDAVMVADKINPQEPAARAFTEQVLDYAREHGIPTSDITVTGHSLGGTLAEIEAWRFGLHGSTFNAYGAAGLGYGIPTGGNTVTNYVEAVDIVSAASPQYGHVVPLATPQDIRLLQEHSFLGEHVHDLEIVAARAKSAHGIANFLPDKNGASILSSGDIQLAQANAQLIGGYRRNIEAMRGTVHLASEIPGNPAWGLSRLGEATQVGVSAIEYAWNKTQEGAERAAHAVKTHLPGFDDPSHPQHALYASLKADFPKGTSEARLAQATAACHAVSINRPEDLAGIHGTGMQVTFVNRSLWHPDAHIDLNHPAPSIEESLRQVEQINQQSTHTAPSQQQVRAAIY